MQLDYVVNTVVKHALDTAFDKVKAVTYAAAAHLGTLVTDGFGASRDFQRRREGKSAMQLFIKVRNGQRQLRNSILPLTLHQLLSMKHKE